MKFCIPFVQTPFHLIPAVSASDLQPALYVDFSPIPYCKQTVSPFHATITTASLEDQVTGHACAASDPGNSRLVFVSEKKKTTMLALLFPGFDRRLMVLPLASFYLYAMGIVELTDFLLLCKYVSAVVCVAEVVGWVLDRNE